MSRTWMFSLAALVVAAAVVGSASAQTSRVGTPATFSDPAGDARTAPDVTSVVVSNDELGLYTFDVKSASAYVSPDVLGLYFDTDSNGNTGSPSGAEWRLFDFESDTSWEFEKWSGADWVDAPASSTVHVTLAADHLTLELSVNGSEIGGAQAFDFYVVTGREDNDDEDFAPDGARVWHYDLQRQVTLSIAGSKASAAKAGGSWVFGVSAMRSDNGKTLGSEGLITCVASAGEVKLRATQRAFVSPGGGSSVAVCAFAVPKKLKGKALRGSITLNYQGASVTKAFTAKAK